MNKLTVNLKMFRIILANGFRFRKRIRQNARWIEGYARKKGFRANPHRLMFLSMNVALEENREMFGRRYCPCFGPTGDPEMDRKLVCPCHFAPADIAANGICHCALFGAGDLSDAALKDANARKMQHRHRPLNLKEGVLDTRGSPLAPRRGLPDPDALSQVKRALGFAGLPLTVIVETEVGADNLAALARLRNLGYQRQAIDGAWRVTLEKGTLEIGGK